MTHLSSLTQDQTKQDKRKIATIVLVMTTGLPVYVVFMSLTGVIDVPMTTFFIGLAPIVGFLMSLLAIIPAYLLGNKMTP
ncbi:hypothetical protein DJ78_12485 [Halorubrum ezzemoulense]|uniref:Uncharacterized protein n=1 Tax=Halorubrum ezzemoulense TaxID=337243 RepID=A0A256JIX6_HALEZ|nr:hypothetical protein DJ78_12485 [Halorubrum ezzemoulense]